MTTTYTTLKDFIDQEISPALPDSGFDVEGFVGALRDAGRIIFDQAIQEDGTIRLDQQGFRWSDEAIADGHHDEVFAATFDRFYAEALQPGRPEMTENSTTQSDPYDMVAEVILNTVSQDSTGCWNWTKTFAYDGSDPYDMEYRTNTDGEGLWVRGEDDEAAWSQTRGTMQFSLADCATDASRRARIVSLDR